MNKAALEFDDAWLEVRSCDGGPLSTEVGEKALLVPAISEVLYAAVDANKHGSMWDYSRRLYKDEREMVKKALGFTEAKEDNRSISLVAHVTFKGSCYTITLFAVKRNQ